VDQSPKQASAHTDDLHGTTWPFTYSSLHAKVLAISQHPGRICMLLWMSTAIHVAAFSVKSARSLASSYW